MVNGAWLFQDRYRLSWWDALIVFVAQVIDRRYLLTEDLQKAQRFGKVQIVNPLAASPDSLLEVESG